ncbi:MAG: ABC transporter ATP-binding protein [Salibacteraceae bacterium]
MAEPILKVENVSKRYRLGTIGTGTLSHDLNRWWHRMRGLPDPYAEVGVENVRENAGGDYVWALRDINFSVNEGDVIGIIGKNGAGKSTLLKVLSRITFPSKGKITYRGRIASLLEVGTGFHPELTGRENIYLNGAILGMTRQEVSKKLEEIVDFSGVAKYIDTPVKRYSSGMTVRLGFAVAAHLEPEILIVDEVLAVGDADFQNKCVKKMKSIRNEGRTILFVSHNMTMVNQLCTKGLVLKNGKIDFVSDNINEATEYYLTGQTSTPDFNQLQGRSGKQNIRLEEAYLTDLSGKKLTTITSGLPLKIHLHLNNSYEENINEHLEIRVNFRTKDDFVLCMLNSRSKSDNFSLIPGVNHIVVTVPKVAFSKGDLFIDFVVKYKNEIEDRLPSALKIHCIEGKFYDSGFIYPKFFNGTLMEHDWNNVTVV